MENRMDFNAEMEDVKSQFKILKDKIEKETIISNKEIQEVGKGRILKYVLLNTGICFIIVCILSPYIIWTMYDKGYPLWTYFSIIYLLLLIILIKVIGYNREKEHIRKIGYDVVQYTEELKWLHTRSIKNKIIISSVFVPIIVNMTLFVRYIILYGHQLYGNQIWWVYVITLIILIFVIKMSFGKNIDRITIIIHK